jgi:hypothetical protein
MPRHSKLLFLLLALALTVPAAATALPSTNPANKLLKRGIDPLQYDRATHCVKKPKTGTLALQSWLQRNSAGETWGIIRCEMWGKKSASLHAEGRAIDWHLDAANPAQKRAAYKLIALLLAPDKAGNRVALARRMGVQGLIFNCQQWFGSPDGELGKYSACYGKNGKRKKVDRTTAHMDHVHIEINKLGAAKKTTFWNARVTWPIEDQFSNPGSTPQPDRHSDQYTGPAGIPSHEFDQTSGGSTDGTPWWKRDNGSAYAARAAAEELPHSY